MPPPLVVTPNATHALRVDVKVKSIVALSSDKIPVIDKSGDKDVPPVTAGAGATTASLTQALLVSV